MKRKMYAPEKHLWHTRKKDKKKRWNPVDIIVDKMEKIGRNRKYSLIYVCSRL